jgi:hypothetical protein
MQLFRREVLVDEIAGTFSARPRPFFDKLGE